MTVTPTKLTAVAGLGAVAAGLLFIGVQIGHPHLDVAFTTTSEWKIRQSVKVVMAVLSLAGVTGMYLYQVKRIGVLGLIGYLVFGLNYLIMLCVEMIGLCVLPSIAHSSPGFVSDILAVATGGHATGDLGLLKTLSVTGGFTYVLGGLIFGIALFRSGVLSRWAAALLAIATTSSIAIPLLPDVNERLFAVPTGVALIGLGYSLWRSQRAASDEARPVAASQSETVSAA